MLTPIYVLPSSYATILLSYKGVSSTPSTVQFYQANSWQTTTRHKPYNCCCAYTNKNCVFQMSFADFAPIS